MKKVLYTYRAICVRIISGDTMEAMIDLGFNTWTKIKVKLHGIISPSVGAKTEKERKKGREARDRLKEILFEEDFILESKSLGKYGRSIANIHCHGHNINQQMIDEGHAIEYVTD